jgi:hypothetical protein
LAGFECSTFLWKDGKRKNYIELTGHDRHLKQDYQKLVQLGIGVVREAVPWPFVDLGNGKYDWKFLDCMIDELNQLKLIPIWDLFHYGLPDDCDPLADDCHKRFLDYCCAVAEHVIAKTEGPYFFTPVNEITFYSAAATDMSWMYPFAKGKYQELKKTLCCLAIDAKSHPRNRIRSGTPITPGHFQKFFAKHESFSKITDNLTLTFKQKLECSRKPFSPCFTTMRSTFLYRNFHF